MKNDQMNLSRFFQIYAFPAMTFPTAPNWQLIQSVVAWSITMLVGVRKNAQEIPLVQLYIHDLYSLLPGKHISVHCKADIKLVGKETVKPHLCWFWNILGELGETRGYWRRSPLRRQVICRQGIGFGGNTVSCLLWAVLYG